MKNVYTCIIVDDEPAAHSVLRSLISKNPKLLLTAQCYNVLEVIEYLRHNDADLLFLDINMPEISGLEFFKLYKSPIRTILTTAYSEFALESYDYDVVDYLLKPISNLRFQRSVQRFLSLYSPVDQFKPNVISIKVDKDIIQLSETDIYFIQSFGNYVKVYTEDRFYLASTTTQELLSGLSQRLFVRVHKSFAVNLEKISSYSEKEITVLNMIIPIGITFKREFTGRLSETDNTP